MYVERLGVLKGLVCMDKSIYLMKGLVSMDKSIYMGTGEWRSGGTVQWSRTFGTQDMVVDKQSHHEARLVRQNRAAGIFGMTSFERAVEGRKIPKP